MEIVEAQIDHDDVEAEPLARRGRELAEERDATAQASWRQTQALVLVHRGEYAEG